MDETSSTTTKKVFVTSALPYVNNQPHLGNIIGSLLSADVYSRFARRRGYDVVYISGTDEYGTAIEMEAEKQNTTPEQIVQKNRVLHKEVYDFFNLDFDYFGHTCTTKHHELVQNIFLKTIDHFDEKEINQMFCPKCKQFLADRYIEGECACGATTHGDQCDTCGRYHEDSQELTNFRCSICKTTPQIKTTKQLFFNLNELQHYFQTMDTTEWSANARAIYTAWMKKKLVPRCITRKLKHMWGVPVPLKEYDDKVFYVWYDAPIGYLSFLQQKLESDQGISDVFEWLKGSKWVLFMGKDNVPFHSIIFPCILYALKEYSVKPIQSENSIVEQIEKIVISEAKHELIGNIKSQKIRDDNMQKELCLDFKYVINATEYLTFNKAKFSKSKKIGIFGLDVCRTHMGDATKWRFYLCKKRPETKDADFNIDEFITVVKTELIDTLGNFINRTLRYIEVKNIHANSWLELPLRPEETDFINEINNEFHQYIQAMEEVSLRGGLEKVLEMARAGNRFIQLHQSFEKDMLNRAFSLGLCLTILLAHCFEPFMPDAFAKLQTILELGSRFPKDLNEIMQTHSKTLKGKVEIVFSKFTKDEEERLQTYNNGV